MTSQLTTTSVKELHKASKLHESNLVTELGDDRIVTRLGVHFIFSLGVLLEVEEIFGSGRGLHVFRKIIQMLSQKWSLNRYPLTAGKYLLQRIMRITAFKEILRASI